MSKTGVQKLTTVYDSPGTDQLQEDIGKARDGDICQIHIIGKIIPKHPPNTGLLASCFPKPTEFIDSTHLTQRVTIEIGKKGYDGLYRGLHAALLEMKFGDVMTFFIPSSLAFGTQGLSKSNVGGNPPPDHIHRNPVPISYLQIEPDQDLKVEITFFRVARKGVWHNRKIKNKNGFWNAGWHSSM